MSITFNEKKKARQSLEKEDRPQADDSNSDKALIGNIIADRNALPA